MNEFGPILACRGPSGPVVILIVFYVVSWWVSGAIALVNACLISSFAIPMRNKLWNFGLLAGYVMPGVILLSGLFNMFPIERIPLPGIIWWSYALAVPFVTIVHFAFLLATRRRLRAEPQTDDGVVAQ